MTDPASPPLTESELGMITFGARQCFTGAGGVSLTMLGSMTLRLLSEHAAQRERIAELERENRLLRTALSAVQARELRGLRVDRDATTEDHEKHNAACDAARKALDALAAHDAAKPGAGEG